MFITHALRATVLPTFKTSAMLARDENKLAVHKRRQIEGCAWVAGP